MSVQFYPGQLIIRINESAPHCPIGSKWIVKKFVRSGELCPNGRNMGIDAVLVYGLPDTDDNLDKTYGWCAHNFRPLDDGDIAEMKTRLTKPIKAGPA